MRFIAEGLGMLRNRLTVQVLGFMSRKGVESTREPCRREVMEKSCPQAPCFWLDFVRTRWERIFCRKPEKGGGGLRPAPPFLGV